jgi:hypothetical protein
MIRPIFAFLAAWLVSSAMLPSSSAATPGNSLPYVAGMAPHQRPANAPAIREFKQTPEWRQTAMQGISEPVPASLKFLNDQGAWYTPFDRAGMPGYYDLRQMHVAPAKPKP